MSGLVAQLVKNLPAMQETGILGDLGLIPGLGGCQLQYFGLENSIDCIAHGVAQYWSDFHFHFGVMSGAKKEWKTTSLKDPVSGRLGSLLRVWFGPWPVPTPISNRLRLDSGPLTLPESLTQS